MYSRTLRSSSEMNLTFPIRHFISTTHIIIIVVVYQMTPPSNEVNDHSRDTEWSKGDASKHGKYVEYIRSVILSYLS